VEQGYLHSIHQLDMVHWSMRVECQLNTRKEERFVCFILFKAAHSLLSYLFDVSFKNIPQSTHRVSLPKSYVNLSLSHSSHPP